MRIIRISSYRRALLALAAPWVLDLGATQINAAELTEGNAEAWGTFASDGEPAGLNNDTSRVKAGQESLRFETASGFDTGVRYPNSGAAHLNVSGNTHLVFWLYGIDTNEPTWQGNQPIIVLNCTGGSLRYTPQRQFTFDRAWSYVRVPLPGDATWQVSTTGTPLLGDVLSLEIHQDTWGSGFTTWYDGLQFVSLNGDLPPPGPPPPPGVHPDRLTPRVLMFAFDPIMPTKGNHRMHEAYGWTDPVLLTRDAIADLRRSSHDLVIASVTNEIHDAYPIQSDGFQYDAESFDYDWTHHQIHNSGFDYRRFVEDYRLAPRILSGEIDEVWVYCGPFGGFWESTMAGDGGYWCNSSPVQGVLSSRLFVIMGLNFERGVGEAIHSFGHRAESILTHQYGQWLPSQINTWSAFALLDKNIPGLGAVGNVHFPVNGQSDYDYANPRNVTSNADDWYNYPDFQGLTRTFNFREWSPDGADPQRQYLNWWYDHMPHKPGRGPDYFLLNWWRYLWDVDSFKASGNLYGTEGVPTVQITDPTPGAAVAGVVHVNAEATVSGALGRVDFYVDGDYQATDTLAPYAFDWDTRGLLGSHTLTTKAYELQNGTETVSAPVQVSIRTGRIMGTITRNGTPSMDVKIDWGGRIPVTYYEESRTNVAIPDNQSGGVTNAMVSRPLGARCSVSVGVTVRHPRPGDLELDLLTPGHERLRLKASEAAGQKDLITIFPALTSSIDDLSSVNPGSNAEDWKLVVRDVVAGSEGTLEAWSRRLATELPLVIVPPTIHPGQFDFGNLPAGIYSITPSGPGRWFWPPSVTMTNLAETNTVDFIETSGPPPAITTPPAGQSVQAGDTVVFEVVASGPALSYQWQFNGNDLSGATEARLTIPDVQPANLGRYHVTVINENGWVVSSEAILAFSELTEGNAGEWDTFASDGAPTSVRDDTSMVKVGQQSLWFDTGSGFDAGVRYPRDGDAAWDLTEKTHLVIWIYANNSNFAFQGWQPVVVLQGPGGSFRYEPQSEVMPNHAWSLQQIPLAGDSRWLRKQVGAPSLAHIDQLEIHQDTWDAGFIIVYDGVEFATLSPPQLRKAQLDVSGVVTFQLHGKAGAPYRIETALDLLDWKPLMDVRTTALLTPIQDSQTQLMNQRFYRVVEK